MSGMKKAARIIQVIMGLLLLVAGLTKIWDPLLFYWESMPYAQLLGIEPERWPLVGKLVQVLGPLECGLGLALVCSWRLQLVFPLATLLMAFFTGLTARAWQVGVTSNCGCFGALVDRSPGEAAVEDTVMLALLIFAWWGTRSLPGPVWPMSRWIVVGGTVLVLVVGGAQFLMGMDRLENSDLQPGMQLSGLEVKGAEIDLRQGDYLVELFSPKCSRCAKVVPKLNEWVDTPGLPQIVALHNMGKDSEVVARFKEHLQPRYQIASISLIDFRRLTWKSGYPRLALVRDGEVKAVWEHYETPSVEQLKNVINW